MARKVALLSGLFCSFFWISMSANAQIFFLNDGTNIEGKITSSTNNTISVMEQNGAIVPLSLADVKEIQIKIAGREEGFAAELTGWKDGIYELRTQRYFMRVAEGEILSVEEILSGEEEGLGIGGPQASDGLPTSGEKTAPPDENIGEPLTSQSIPNATM